MLPTTLPSSLRVVAVCWLATALLAPGAAQAQAARAAAPPGDYIVAIVDRELITNSEVQQRIVAVQREAALNGNRLPPPDEMRRQVLEALVDERAQLSSARETGVRIDEPELDRAVANVAAQNRITLTQLRERMQRDGVDFARFRSNLRDQMLLERVREREVQKLIKITDGEIEVLLQSRASGAAPPEYNVAQVLVTVPESASEAEVAQRRAIAEKALARAQSGEDFGRIVNELSDGAKEQGGSFGLRPLDRLPDLFANAVREVRAQAVVPQVLRSGAGFHVLKVIERREGGMLIEQVRARHILLRPSAQLSQQAAVDRLKEFKQQVLAGKATFAQLARDNSEDGSAQQGGDLGWASPGQFVPEFENGMKPLAQNEISDPVTSRFGVHLIQVMDRRKVPVDRKQQREIARNVLREQKFEAAYAEWSRDVRARAYVEMREPPQ
jgi:peptidyl-prolyl cis-trans isomerase SurA